MIVCTLTWQEPEEGSHVILFPNEDFEDLLEVAKWVKSKMGGEVGDTIAAMKLSQKKGKPTDDDPWGDLALNVRYSSGEELYDEDCPTFVKRGQERS
jgi:hypothetical protein